MRQPPATYGCARVRWRLADLRAVVPWAKHYSLPGLSRALRRLKIGWQRGRLRLHSPDLAYQAKCRLIERVRSQALLPSRPLVVLYGDEFSLYRQPTLASAYAPYQHQPTAPLSCRHNGYYRFSGALDLATGRLTWLGASRMGSENLQRFLSKLRAVYPTQRLCLIWDNWPVHQHPTVLAQAAELAIELLWLPTYAPWLNPIEKVWRWLTQDLLHLHSCAAHFDVLQQRVKVWLDQFARPAPDLLRYVGEAPT